MKNKKGFHNCLKKTVYRSREKAELAATNINKENLDKYGSDAVLLEVYHCNECYDFHLTKGHKLAVNQLLERIEELETSLKEGIGNNKIYRLFVDDLTVSVVTLLVEGDNGSIIKRKLRLLNHEYNYQISILKKRFKVRNTDKLVEKLNKLLS